MAVDSVPGIVHSIGPEIGTPGMTLFVETAHQNMELSSYRIWDRYQ